MCSPVHLDTSKTYSCTWNTGNIIEMEERKILRNWRSENFLSEVLYLRISEATPIKTQQYGWSNVNRTRMIPMDLLKWVWETPIGLIPIPRVVLNLGIVVRCKIDSMVGEYIQVKLNQLKRLYFWNICVYTYGYMYAKQLKKGSWTWRRERKNIWELFGGGKKKSEMLLYYYLKSKETKLKQVLKFFWVTYRCLILFHWLMFPPSC